MSGDGLRDVAETGNSSSIDMIYINMSTRQYWSSIEAFNTVKLKVVIGLNRTPIL